MTTKHTPGPWRVATDMYGIGNIPVAGVETNAGLSIANCGTNGEANARLIAAAPDLLAALETLRNARYGGNEWADACKVAREAIAKAKGE